VSGISNRPVWRLGEVGAKVWHSRAPILGHIVALAHLAVERHDIAVGSSGSMVAVDGEWVSALVETSAIMFAALMSTKIRVEITMTEMA
jgi:hypothetical protein